MINIYFKYNFVIIIIEKKGGEVKGEANIYFKTFEMLKGLKAQDPEGFENVTEKDFEQKIHGEREVKLYDGSSTGGNFGVYDGALCI